MMTLVILLLLVHDGPNHEWFEGLHAQNGVWCCHENDAVPDVPWRVQNGRYQVLYLDEWLEVPEGAVINTPNRDGRTWLWPNKGYAGVRVACFMPGPGT